MFRKNTELLRIIFACHNHFFAIKHTAFRPQLLDRNLLPPLSTCYPKVILLQEVSVLSLLLFYDERPASSR